MLASHSLCLSSAPSSRAYILRDVVVDVEQAQELRSILLSPSGTHVKLQLAHEADQGAENVATFDVELVRGGSGLCLAQKDAGTLRPDMQ